MMNLQIFNFCNEKGLDEDGTRHIAKLHSDFLIGNHFLIASLMITFKKFACGSKERKPL